MIYIKPFDKFRMNEGILDAFKSLFKGVGKIYKNVKGGDKLKEILERYKKQIDDIFTKLTNAQQTLKSDKLTEGLDDDTEEKTNDTEKMDTSDVKEIVNQLKKRLEVLKQRFTKEISMVVTKFKTPKIENLSFLTQNELEDYVYEKYEIFFKSINDQNSLKKISKNRLETKKKMSDSIKKIQADISTKGVDINIVVNKNYIYKNQKNQNVYVQVIEIDKDKDGKENKLLSKVKNKNGDEFYVLKTKLISIKKGDKYKYINKDGEESDVEIVEVDDMGNVTKVKNDKGNEFDPIDSNIS
jgi:Skp family chaperone for outer membrane proteins